MVDTKISDEIVGGVLNNLAHLQDLVESIQKLTDTYNTLKYKVENLEDELAKKRQELIEKESWANLGKLSTFIAHEIRSPINAITLYIEHLKEYVNSETFKPLNLKLETSTILSNMELAANNINGFINDMLNFSSDFKLVKEQVLVSEFIANLQKKINALIRKNQNVEIRFDLKNDFVIDVDKKYFEQALFNLIKNANESFSLPPLNSSPSHLLNSIVVSFSKDQYNFYTCVQDTGNGIPQNIVNNLFTPFSSSKREGFGLGLAFTKKIINAHNGAIELKSTGHNGTTFLISLPLPDSHILDV